MTDAQKTTATNDLTKFCGAGSGSTGGSLIINGVPYGDPASAIAELTGLDEGDMGFFLSDLEAVLHELALYNDPLQAKAERYHAIMHITIDGDGYQPGRTSTSYSR